MRAFSPSIQLHDACILFRLNLDSGVQPFRKATGTRRAVGNFTLCLSLDVSLLDAGAGAGADASSLPRELYSVVCDLLHQV